MRNIEYYRKRDEEKFRRSPFLRTAYALLMAGGLFGPWGKQSEVNPLGDGKTETGAREKGVADAKPKANSARTQIRDSF